MLRFQAAAAVLLTVPSVAFAQGQVITARGQWAAVERGGRCEALARPERRGTAAIAGFTFARDSKPWGRLMVRLSRIPRASSSVMAVIGGRSFLLDSAGGWAWSRDPVQQRALLELVRLEGSLRIDFRDRSGRRVRDYYALRGAPTAIDAAAARCSFSGQAR